MFTDNRPASGVVSASFANPIWLVKTRLQLDRLPNRTRKSIRQVVRSIYAADGVRGFWRGVTASYVGVSETIVQFVLYEHLRAATVERLLVRQSDADELTSPTARQATFIAFMLCGGSSKLIATTFAYPHEVIRTRLREEGTKYTSFSGTVAVILREEGLRAFYK